MLRSLSGDPWRVRESGAGGGGCKGPGCQDASHIYFRRKSLSGWFLGIWPRLNDDGSSATRTFSTAAKNVLYNPINFTKVLFSIVNLVLACDERGWQERSSIETVGTGSLMVKLSVITRGFDKYGTGTNPAVEEAWRKQQGE